VTIRFELSDESSLSAHRQLSLDQKPLGLRGDRKLLMRSVIVKYLRDARPAPAGSSLVLRPRASNISEEWDLEGR